jgi:hypothetical protein
MSGRDDAPASGWAEAARTRLLEARSGRPGWGYRPDGSPCVEPTVLCSLALLASDPERGRALEAARAAGDWLASIQRRDGSLGISEALAAPGWPTAHALLLWRALGIHEAPRRLAAGWLLGRKGNSVPLGPTNLSGHDSTIVGWPWVEDTHSWLEPTALAVLALRGEGMGDHPRVVEGLRLIRNRALPSGGWNYGNVSTFGRELRPQPGPTGLALLALAGLDEARGPAEKAIGYLEATLPNIRAAESLGWGLTALDAWGRRPGLADVWLGEAYRSGLRRAESPPRWAHLLLATGAHTSGLLGVAKGGRLDG